MIRTGFSRMQMEPACRAALGRNVSGTRRFGTMVGVSAAPSIVDVTDQSFTVDVVEASHVQPVVVDFWAAWCGPCRALTPILEDTIAKHGGITLAKLDTDANPRTAAIFGIRGIPAVKGFKDGRVAAEFVGLQPRPRVEQFLHSLVPPVEPPVPGDEAGLMATLTSDPGNRVARRALGQLLFDARRFDDAFEAVSVAPDDPVCDGLRARIELIRDGDGASARFQNGTGAHQAVRDLIAAIRGSSEPARSRLRRIAVGVIESERERDPSIEQLRRELAAALY